MFTASDIIHTHTRADLLEDGDLVDVSALAQEAGFRVPVAVTRAVWADCVAWSEEDTKHIGPGDDAEPVITGFSRHTCKNGSQD